jgi:flavin reductase (DIM6/NTAB) family NADH-FMN oxidoreductase RutF
VEARLTDRPARVPRTKKGLDPATFFKIMAAFPTGVAVVTALDKSGHARGLTCNALCSVSADPPLMLVCVEKNSTTLPAIRQGGVFAVNYLAAGREAVARLFASKEPDKFAEVPWQPGGNGMPWLHQDSVALAECTLTQEIEAGDHVIFIGHVDGGRPPEDGARPLLFFRKGYGTLTGA